MALLDWTEVVSSPSPFTISNKRQNLQNDLQSLSACLVALRTDGVPCSGAAEAGPEKGGRNFNLKTPHTSASATGWGLQPNSEGQPVSSPLTRDFTSRSVSDNVVLDPYLNSD